MNRGARGFSVVELLVAMAVMSACGAALLSLLVGAHRIARRQPEAADQQQRARTAIETLERELSLAGAGFDRGPRAGSLIQAFAPVEPSVDGGITIWYISSATAQAPIVDALAPAATSAALGDIGACPAGTPTCAFSANSTVLMFDPSGCHDFARVDGVSATDLVLRSATRRCAYPSGTWVGEGEVRTYRVDLAARQLLRRDEATGFVQPVLDKVSAMGVEFLDSGRRIRIVIRFASVLLQVPDLTLTVDAAPANLQEG
jgi:prepilin-type N-terminal cleavage/methylation domain-containing protein